MRVWASPGVWEQEKSTYNVQNSLVATWGRIARKRSRSGDRSYSWRKRSRSGDRSYRRAVCCGSLFQFLLSSSRYTKNASHRNLRSLKRRINNTLKIAADPLWIPPCGNSLSNSHSAHQNSHSGHQNFHSGHQNFHSGHPLFLISIRTLDFTGFVEIAFRAI